MIDMQVIEPTDEKLLEAERAELGLLERLKGEVYAAYLIARERTSDYKQVDCMWDGLFGTCNEIELPRKRRTRTVN